MIIGLFGYAGSGKTTVAQHLVKKHKFKQVNFKDALVEEMKVNFPDLLKEIAYNTDLLNQYETGVGESMTIKELFEQKPPVMRALMQNYGTDVRRKGNENYWVKKWVKATKGLRSNIVTDDVRFYNELSALTEKDAIFIRVKRDDITKAGSHVSETTQEHFIEDFTVHGVKGDHHALLKQVDEVIHDIKNNTD